MLVDSAGSLGIVGLGGPVDSSSHNCVRMNLLTVHNFQVIKSFLMYVQSKPLQMFLVPCANIKLKM